MKKYLSKIILIFALLFFVLAIVLFVQAVLGSLVLLALWRIIDLLEADRK